MAFDGTDARDLKGGAGLKTPVANSASQSMGSRKKLEVTNETHARKRGALLKPFKDTYLVLLPQFLADKLVLPKQFKKRIDGKVRRIAQEKIIDSKLRSSFCL